MAERNLKIGFIGAGSIGSLFGGYLASLSTPHYSIGVTFFCRDLHTKAINENGLRLKNNDGIQNIKVIKAYEEPDHFDDKYVFDFLFLSTKTYDIEHVMKKYKNLVQKCKWLVILQNGIGNEDIIERFCKREKIIRVITSNGALLKAPGHVVHTGKGYTKIGFPFLEKISADDETLKIAQSDLSLLKELLDASGLETTIYDDIIKEIWEKVFVNIGINAFGALTRLKNGQLLQDEHLKGLMGDAVMEAVKIAELKQIKLSKKDYAASAYDVAEKTSDNKNSMLQDILKGKKTEIDFINGRIVEYAREFKIEVPINALLTYLVKGVERSYI